MGIEIFDAAAALGAFESYTQASCIATGIPSLDASIGGGLTVGQVTTLLGYTGVGKSEVARQIRSHAVKTGHPVVHVDVELGARQIIERDIAQAAQIASSSVRRKLFQKDELERYNEALPKLKSRKHFVIMEPEQGTALKMLGESVKKQLASFATTKPALVIFDSAQRLADGVVHDNDRVRVQRFCRWVESFAHSTNAAVLVTSEQSRGEDGKAPTPDRALTSGAESRALEFISHLQLVLFAEGRITSREAGDATAESVRVIRVLITKARDGDEGWVRQDLHMVKPYWNMRLASSGEVNDELLCRCAGQLENGRLYNMKELEIVWAATTKRAKLIRDGLIESGLLSKRGHSWLSEKNSSTSEKIVDQEEVLV